MTRFLLFEGLGALEQPKLSPQAGRASGQSSSLDLDPVHRKRQSTEQIQLYALVHRWFHQ
jgi:hypothetical protein